MTHDDEGPGRTQPSSTPSPSPSIFVSQAPKAAARPLPRVAGIVAAASMPSSVNQ
jgi:hypothetical protein